jgi:hypothetical protein
MTRFMHRTVALAVIGLFCLIACADYLDHGHDRPDHCTLCHVAGLPGLPTASTLPVAPVGRVLGVVVLLPDVLVSFGGSLQLACRAPPAPFLLSA